MRPGLHPSHETRFSDASTFDEICVNCGATDELGSWGALAQACPKEPPRHAAQQILDDDRPRARQ